MLANTLAFFIAYLLYTPIAHGLTGGHTRELTNAQLVMHCLALGVVSLIIYGAQRFVFRPYLKISLFRIGLAILAFIAFFWIGYYQTWISDGPDYDILFAFTVLGAALWIGQIPFREAPWAYIIAFLAFPFASFVGELFLLLVVTGLELQIDMQTGMLHHTLFWLAIGTATGLLGGWISGKALSRLLSGQVTYTPN